MPVSLDSTFLLAPSVFSNVIFKRGKYQTFKEQLISFLKLIHGQVFSTDKVTCNTTDQYLVLFHFICSKSFIEELEDKTLL